MNELHESTSRPRAPWWKRWLRRAGLVLLVLLLIYTPLLIRFNLRSASVQTDHYAALNAAASKLPSGPHPTEVYEQIRVEWDAAVEKAEQAILSRSAGIVDNHDPFGGGAPHPPVFKAFPSLDPEHPDHDVAIETLRAFRPTLEPAYAAAKQTHPGSVLAPRAGVTGPLAPSLLTADLPDFGSARAVARLMAADHRLAASEGDSDRAIRSLLGIYDLAEQTGRQPLLISGLVKLAIGQVADGTLRETLTGHPDLFTAAQLAQLAGQIPKPRPDDFDSFILSERRVVDDLVQRLYTDNNRGGGVITPTGVAFLLRGGPLGPGRNGPGIGARLAGPLIAPFLDTRQEVTAKIDQEFQAAIVASHDPARLGGMYDGFLTSLDKKELLRTLRLAEAGPVLAKSVIGNHRARAERDTALVLLAAHRYRLDHGAFPDSIDRLTPGYLATLPADPFAPGQTLRLTPKLGGVWIYSTGVDGTDNGGTPYDTSLAQDRVTHDLESFANNTTRVDAQGADWILFPDRERVLEQVGERSDEP